jgi:ketosteroid isomerase-like protein
MRSGLLSFMLLALNTQILVGQQVSKLENRSIRLPPSLRLVLTDYENGWKAGNAAALALLFTEDGFVLSPGQPPVRGRAAIRKLYTGPGSPLSLRAFVYAINGNMGYIVGGYSSSPGMSDEGKFTLILRKRHGRWLIAADMDNENRRH